MALLCDRGAGQWPAALDGIIPRMGQEYQAWKRAALREGLDVTGPMPTDPRIALVTGASSGFGKATASLLAGRGLRVFGTSRAPRGDRGDGFEMLELDVDSDASVDRCVSEVQRTAGPSTCW